MIEGAVNENLEATIHLTLSGGAWRGDRGLGLTVGMLAGLI